MPYLGIFGLKLENNIVIFETPSICLIANFSGKTKISGLKLPYFGILGLQLESNIVIFEIIALEFVFLEILWKNENT